MRGALVAAVMALTVIGLDMAAAETEVGPGASPLQQRSDLPSLPVPQPPASQSRPLTVQQEAPEKTAAPAAAAATDGTIAADPVVESEPAPETVQDAIAPETPAPKTPGPETTAPETAGPETPASGADTDPTAASNATPDSEDASQGDEPQGDEPQGDEPQGDEPQSDAAERDADRDDTALEDSAPDAAADEATLDEEAFVPVPLPGQRPALLRLSVQKLADGAVRYRGTVPTADMRARLVAALHDWAEDQGTNARGQITVDPSADRGRISLERWEAQALSGLGALADLTAGHLFVFAQGVHVRGTVADGFAVERISASMGPGWRLEVSVPAPTPDPWLLLTFDPKGAVGDGALPAGLSPEAFQRTLPDVDLPYGLELGGSGDLALWRDALDALSLLGPRMETGSVRLAGTELSVVGTLRQGFSGQDTRAAVRAIIGPGWDLAVELEERPPDAILDVIKSDEGVQLSGILPVGLSPEAAQMRTGGADGQGLISGGAGDPLAWRRAIDALGTVLGAYERAEARISAGRLQVDGLFWPGQERSVLADWVSVAAGPGWRIAVAGEERAAAEGDTRRDVLTGTRERLVEGYWWPEIDLAPSTESCARAVADAQRRMKVSFVVGQARLEPRAAPAINWLAAIAAICLDRTGLSLEIGGHTDNRGTEQQNARLSQARAEAVRQALIRRGISAGSVDAVGYGERQPIASNETAAGRARNRRIGFTWLSPPGRPEQEVLPADAVSGAGPEALGDALDPGGAAEVPAQREAAKAQDTGAQDTGAQDAGAEQAGAERAAETPTPPRPVTSP